MNRPDCWEILGINPTRNPDRIRDAFRKKAKLYHPDSSAHYTSPKENIILLKLKLRRMKLFIELNLIIYQQPMKSFLKILLSKFSQQINSTICSRVFQISH